MAVLKVWDGSQWVEVSSWISLSGDYISLSGYEAMTGPLTGTFVGDGSGLTGVARGSGDYLPLSGGQMTGDIDMNENALNNVDSIQFKVDATPTHSEGQIHGTDGFVFEVRGDDPVAPIQGQAWFRSDL